MKSGVKSSSKSGAKVDRLLTKNLKTPYDDQKFEPRRSEIREPDGRVVFEKDGVMVPATWSPVATDILAQKYFRRAGVPQPDGSTGGETDSRQVFDRLASCWTDWGTKHGYFDGEVSAKNFSDEIRYMLAHQMAAPNSPQWFNTGLHTAYGITGPAQGHYYVDPKTGEVKSSTSAFERPQPHACQPYRALVSTPRGPIPIGRIVEEKLVGTEIFDRSGTTKVLAVKSNGTKEVLRVTLKNGRQLEVTADHLVWVEKAPGSGPKEAHGWLPAGEIRPGMRLTQQTNTAAVRCENSLPLAEVTLAGWLQGDGFVGQYEQGTNRSLTIEFMTANEDEFNFLLPLIEEVFPDVHRKVRYVETENSDLDVRRIRLYGECLRPFVEKYELMNRGIDLRVPSVLFHSGMNCLAAYVKALFQTDGGVRNHKGDTDSYDVVLGNISRGLLGQVQEILANLGIYSRITECRDKRSDRHPYFHLIVAYKSERRKFDEMVGFVSSDKVNKLRESLRPEVRGKAIPAERQELVLRVESVGKEPVYDIQTASGEYLSGNLVVHNCFIQSVDDSLVGDGGIMDLWVRESRLFKYGSGTGTNFSNLRAAGEKLSGGGRSSGLLSFLKVGDKAAGSVKSGGTTRRAAKMVCLDMDHPEIEDFILWKVKEEEKVSALVTGSKVTKKALSEIFKACGAKGGTSLEKNATLKEAVKKAREMCIPDGFIERALKLAAQGRTIEEFPDLDTNWEGEAYGTVSGQNANNTVRISNDFFLALENDGDWALKFRSTNTVAKTLSAQSLWDKIVYAAWASADPGLQFHTTINEWHTCPAGGEIRASNPCSEYMFLDDTACNLASLNLIKFYDPKTREFDVVKYRHACRLWTMVLEISVLMAQFPSREIAQRSFEYRTLGLGYANLGALLMTMGIPYGSAKAQAIAASLTAILTGEAYLTSAHLAKDLGPFKRWDENKVPMMRVLRNHRRAAWGETDFEGLTIAPQTIDPMECPARLLEHARQTWDQALAMGEKYGFRNAQVSVIAPTGTIGLLMDCDTTGIEPDFALVKFKKLSGGGYFRIINQSVPAALTALGYSSDQVRAIIQYATGAGTLEGAPCINRESLKAKGLTDEKIDGAEGRIKSSFNLALAFAPVNLADLGYTRSEIEAANDYVFGMMTVEGAPGLKKEHLPVFDCANRCGAKGTRSLHANQHLDMMAAAQPFLSGAISKTINLPHEAQLADVSDAYLAAWKRCLKAVSLYRDGSKLSQPLSSALLVDKEEATEETAKAKAPQFPRAVRHELPHRRFGYTVKATIGGQRIYLRTGEYENGQLGEIFIDIYKEGAAYRSIMNALAISVSLGLQYGVPLEEYVGKFLHFRFEPNGFVADHDHIRFCSSIVDYIFRDLALNYLGRTDVVQIPPKGPVPRRIGSAGGMEMEASAPAPQATIEIKAPSDMGLSQKEWDDDQAMSQKVAKASGYEGNACPDCGQFTMVRSGTCLRCLSCGGTSGCS